MVCWALVTHKLFEEVVWLFWDLLLLPIPVTLVAAPGQKNICQVVGWVRPAKCFPFFVISVFVAGQGVFFIEMWGDMEAVSWLVQTLQSKSPTRASQRNPLWGPSRVFRTGNDYCIASFSLLWFGILWIFSVRCETLGSLSLCTPASHGGT